eukprot:9656356-Lingulodinium_polyedra.AAC.1
MATAELKSRIEKTGEDPPKKMPAAERAARHSKLAARLTGLTLEGELECSHALVDRVCQMMEDG